MNRYTIIKGFFLTAAVAISACSGKEQQATTQAGDEAVKVEVAKSDFRPVEQVNTFTGTVEADVTNNIAPQSAMRIKKVYLEVGDHVKAGQK